MRRTASAASGDQHGKASTTPRALLACHTAPGASSAPTLRVVSQHVQHWHDEKWPANPRHLSLSPAYHPTHPPGRCQHSNSNHDSQDYCPQPPPLPPNAAAELWESHLTNREVPVVYREVVRYVPVTTYYSVHQPAPPSPPAERHTIRVAGGFKSFPDGVHARRALFYGTGIDAAQGGRAAGANTASERRFEEAQARLLRRGMGYRVPSEAAMVHARSRPPEPTHREGDRSASQSARLRHSSSAPGLLPHVQPSINPEMRRAPHLSSRCWPGKELEPRRVSRRGWPQPGTRLPRPTGPGYKQVFLREP